MDVSTRIFEVPAGTHLFVKVAPPNRSLSARAPQSRTARARRPEARRAKFTGCLAWLLARYRRIEDSGHAVGHDRRSAMLVPRRIHITYTKAPRVARHLGCGAGPILGGGGLPASREQGLAALKRALVQLPAWDDVNAEPSFETKIHLRA